MPVTVTMSRGNPLPWPIALLLTIVGAVLIVLGFTVIPPLDDMGGDFGNTILLFIAGLIIVPTLLVTLLVLLRGTKRHRSNDAAVSAVPEELPEPPSRDDAALVATVVGEGTPSRRAVAATVLELAARGVLDVQEYGPKLVIVVPPRAEGSTPEDALVLSALRARADDGTVTGPPIWEGKVDWWRDYAKGARSRALTAGHVQTRLPFIGLILFTVMIATAVSMIFFSRTAVFVGCIVLANGFPHLIARASGYRLTTKGQVERARWRAFGRHLHALRSTRDVGPAAVAVWGPNLVYGVVLGEAPRAARPLTPDGDDDTEDPVSTTQVYEL
jgi:hypothetical protein